MQIKCEDKNCAEKHGALKHWLMLRVTAVIAIPLCIWLVYSIVSLAGADRATFIQWLAKPVNAFEMCLFIVVVFLHAALGAHEIVEDYTHNECFKRLKIFGINLFFLAGGAVSIAAVIKIAFAGGA